MNSHVNVDMNEDREGLTWNDIERSCCCPTLVMKVSFIQSSRFSECWTMNQIVLTLYKVWSWLLDKSDNPRYEGGGGAGTPSQAQ